MRNRLASGFGLKLDLIVTVMMIVCCSTSLAWAQCERWVPTNGPSGGHVLWLSIDPLTPDTLYAGTYTGVFRSVDQGGHWTAVNTGLPEDSGWALPVYRLAIDPLTPATLYASPVEHGVYRSTDRGDHWTAVNTGLTSPYIYLLAIDPATPSTLYVGTYGGVFRSTDRGDHWTAASNGLGQLRVNSLAIDPTTPATLYAGTSEGGVFRSTDRGDHWTSVSSGLSGQWVTSLAVDPATPTTLYVGTLGGTFRSMDRGDQWNIVNTLRVDSLAIDPATPATLYVGTYFGVFRSTDRGDHWTAVNTGLTHPHVNTLAIDPDSPATLYTGTEEGGVFRSTDRGDHWTTASTGITNLHISSLAIDPASPATLYAGTGASGVFRSTDRGDHWTAVNTGLMSLSVGSLAIDPATPAALYAGTGGGVFRTTDQGNHWTAISSGLTTLHVRSLAIDPGTPATLYAGAAGGGVFRSTDRGDHWTAVNTGIANLHVSSLAIDPATPATLYVGTEGGVFRSTDRGDQWTAVNNFTVKSLAIDPATPATLYAGTWGNGVLRSTDRGDHWMPITTEFTVSFVNALAIDPKTPATLYAAADLFGVFRSTDRGDHWTAVNRGLRAMRVYPLAIDPATPATVYAAGEYGGVFRLEWDCALHFSQFGNGLGFTSDVVLINPSPSNTVSGAIGAADDLGFFLAVGLNGGPDFSILPLGAQTLSTDGLGGLLAGSAAVGADGVLGGVVRFSIPGIGVAGVGASEPTTGFVIPVRRTAAINTGVAFSNPELHTIALALTLRNLQGQEVSGGRRTIQDFPTRAHLAQFIHELFPEAFPEAQTGAFEGTLVVVATGGKIAATALELGREPGQFTTLPVIPLATGSAATDFAFAQFGNGQGFTSDSLLVNPSADRSVSGTVKFYDEQGQAMPVGLGGPGGQTSQAFSIPPMGMVRISTDGSGAVTVGSATVSADGPVGGVVRFQIPGVGIAGVGSSASLTRCLIPVRRTSAGIRTGIALQNREEGPVTIRLTLRNTSGAAVATGTIDSLPARGHVAKFVEELFPDVTGQFQGTLSVEVTGGTVAATAIELGSKPGEFTTLPVTPVQ